MNKKIGFIGCGKMASAIIGGAISSKFVEKDCITASEITEEIAAQKSEALGIEVITNNIDLVKKSDIVFVATVPRFVEDVLNEIKDYVTNDKLVISIAAGVTTKFIESILPQGSRVIRVMPNTPMLLLEGMSGVLKGANATEEDINFTTELLSKLGKCIVADDEAQMDIITAISGSGPAFYYKIINEIARAGEKLGLDYEKALVLSMQTAIGAAKMLMNTDKSAEELVESVATKGGCTRVGVDRMIDYKTDQVGTGALSQAAQKYAAQISAYKQAAQLLYPGKKIRSAVVFVRESEMLEL